MRNNKETYLCGNGHRQALGNGTDKPRVPEAVPRGLGGGGGTEGQKRARMLVSGSGDGGGGQRTVGTQNRARMRSILGLGGGGGTGGQKRARMLVSGSGDGGGGQRIIKTPKSSTYVLDFGVGRWRPQAKAVRTPKRAQILVSGVVAGRTLKTSSRACFQVGRMVVAAKECPNPENEHVLLVFGVGGWWVNQ